MNQQTSKESDLNQVRVEHALLHLCLDKFPDLEGKVEHCQLKKMQNKYQFYLRKFHKITEEFNKYKELFENIEDTVEESPQIIEENRSIDFINKVMQETFRNFNKLKESVDSMKLKKQTNQNQKVRLKNILLKMKGEYFELQRKQEECIQNKKIENVHCQSKENFRNMFKIRQDKRSQQKQPKIKPIQMNKLTMDVSFAEKRIISELDTINTLKEEFLTLVGTNLNDFYKTKEKELYKRQKDNKLIFKKNLPQHYNSHKKKTVEDYQPQNEVFSVHRILNEYQNQEEEFMRLSNGQIIDLIVKKDKVNDMLHLIEEEKRGMVEAYRKNKIDRFRLN